MSDPTRIETTDATTTKWEWNGHTYTVPAAVDDWDPDILKAFELGQTVVALEGVLGKSQYAQMRVRGLKVRDIGAVMDSLASVYGFVSAGE